MRKFILLISKQHHVLCLFLDMAEKIPGYSRTLTHWSTDPSCIIEGRLPVVALPEWRIHVCVNILVGSHHITVDFLKSFHNRKSVTDLGLYSLSGKTSYCKISWSLEAMRFGLRLLIILKFDRYLSISAANMPVKRLRDMIIITSNLVASKLHKIWWKMSSHLVNRSPSELWDVSWEIKLSSM